MKLCAALLLAAALAASGAAALDMPGGARLAREQSQPLGSYAVPIAAFAGEAVPSVLLRGAVTRQAWHVRGSALTPMQAVDMLARQVLAEGYALAFSCETDRCGGFDFRFDTEVMDAPDMFVNLRNFHFASFLRGPEGAPVAALTVLASRAQGRLYLQIVSVGAQESLPPGAWDKPPSDAGAQAQQAQTAGELAKTLLTRGSVVLDGLEFESGAAALGPGPFAALAQFAQVLEDNPELRVALVGHTDSVGGLEGNIRLSRQRAEAVRARLAERFGIDAARLDADGVGYLAPRATNQTAEGREANRRVEAVMLTAQ